MFIFCVPSITDVRKNYLFLLLNVKNHIEWRSDIFNVTSVIKQVQISSETCFSNCDVVKKFGLENEILF